MELHSNRSQHPVFRDSRTGSDVLPNNSGRAFPILGKLLGARRISSHRDQSHDGRRVGHRQHLRLYSVILGLCPLLTPLAVVAAEDTPITAIANPQATSSGSVTNQAVQVLQGPYATNSYGGGVSCQGPTMNITPFLSSSVSGQWPYEAYAELDEHPGPDRTGQKNSWSFNPGVSLTISIPLDAQLQDQCKSAAATWTRRQKAEADKARLDFELVRLLRCGEAMKAGISFHPRSPYAKICGDVVVRVKQPTPKPASSSPSGTPSSASK